MTSGKQIPVGRVRSTNATRREVRVEMLRGFAWPKRAPEWVRFEGASAPKRQLKVDRARPDAAGAILAFPPGVPRDVLAPLEGARLVVAEEAKDSWRKDGLNAAAWLGFTLVDDAGRSLGKIVEVWEGAANAAMTVEDEAQGTMTLPVIEEVILAIDSEAGTVTVGDVEPFAVRDED